MNNFRHLVVRGDKFCYEKKNTIFPYIEDISSFQTPDPFDSSCYINLESQFKTVGDKYE